MNRLSEPCSNEYRGAQAFSEFESRVVRQFVNKYKMQAFVSIHAYGQMIVYPYANGSTSVHENALVRERARIATTVMQLQHTTGTAMAHAMFAVNKRAYRTGTMPQLLSGFACN
jgi:hypothetical protein